MNYYILKFISLSPLTTGNERSSAVPVLPPLALGEPGWPPSYGAAVEDLPPTPTPAPRLSLGELGCM